MNVLIHKKNNFKMSNHTNIWHTIKLSQNRFLIPAFGKHSDRVITWKSLDFMSYFKISKFFFQVMFIPHFMTATNWVNHQFRHTLDATFSAYWGENRIFMLLLWLEQELSKYLVSKFSSKTKTLRNIFTSFSVRVC